MKLLKVTLYDGSEAVVNMEKVMFFQTYSWYDRSKSQHIVEDNLSILYLSTNAEDAIIVEMPFEDLVNLLDIE